MPRNQSKGAFATALMGCLAVVIVMTILSFVSAWVAMLIWNSIMPILFHLTAITYWQMYLLLILIGIAIMPIGYRPSNKTSE